MVVEEQFLSAIELIADKLGIAASEIFNIFVNAQVVLGILSILEATIVLLLCIGTYFLVTKMISGHYTFKNAVKEAVKEAEEKNEYMDSDVKSFLLVVPVFAGLCSFLVWGILVSTIKHGIIKIICPEYSGIIEIINLII